MWARIYAIFIARNREFYRDSAGLIWNLIMPVMMILAFAFIFDGQQQPLFKVGVIGAPAPDSPLASFLAKPQINVIAVLDERAAIDAAIQKVERHQLDLLLDAQPPPRYWLNPQATQAPILEELLLAQYQTTSLPTANPNSPITALPQRQLADGLALSYADWALPGVLAMNVMFSSLWGVGWVVVRYRKNGVLRRLKATPLRPMEFLIAQVLSRLIVVLGASTLVYAGAYLLLDPPMRGSYLALIALYAAGALCMISLGLTVAARLRTEELADGLLNLLSWPMLLLSGVWFSMEGTSAAAQAISHLIPLTYLVDGARAVMIDGAGLVQVLPQIGLLLGIGVALMGLAAHLFRWE
ncbi:ABC transporter permease [Thiorhodovibrio frisius]|uniref:ABC-type multidrug transport system, permease component n=1 Tax=Thiorhodovibrio frisius TaxID=631362 RepID=H8Z8F0_9GAMM|nr:ABC transporter permease [Thiorhodovibrio frisius]EIC19355.1 ABC-type multidrug transport system, permease component [Thiorhodovibrio frisius]WPL22346.1 Inner membrane transport permease YbhS [Thiorhodovibrio frisius]